jgi:hypothetical protein
MIWTIKKVGWAKTYPGVQSINNVYAIVDKVKSVLVNTHIFDLIDNGVYVVYALYFSTIFWRKKLTRKLIEKTFDLYLNFIFIILLVDKEFSDVGVK